MTSYPQEPLDGNPRLPNPVTRARVSELLSTYQELRAHGRSLMSRVRASLHEMRTQRERIALERSENGGHAPADRLAAARRLEQEYGMTPREVEVALLLAKGCSNSTVARSLGISPHTARHHTQHVLGKLGVHTRAEAGARLRG